MYRENRSRGVREMNRRKQERQKKIEEILTGEADEKGKTREREDKTETRRERQKRQKSDRRKKIEEIETGDSRKINIRREV